MEWQEVAEKLFYFLSSAVVFWVGKSIAKMSDSVEQLNIKMAALLEKVNSHEHRISRLEDKGE
jgi:cell division protein FtsL